LADEKGIALSVAAGRTVSINGNRSLISQALANLVDNAIKYSGAGGRVAIETSESGGTATLAVSDAGPGIPTSERAHVVERFVRLEASRHSPGTGLGLSLVAAVARLHDARFALDDNNPGLKAVLTFRTRPTRSGTH
jgi:signal transduction histidine kinase